MSKPDQAHLRSGGRRRLLRHGEVGRRDAVRAREQLVDARVELLGRLDVEPALQQRRVPDQARERLRRGRLLVRLELRATCAVGLGALRMRRVLTSSRSKKGICQQQDKSVHIGFVQSMKS